MWASGARHTTAVNKGTALKIHYLRRQGHPWNHKRIYRIWKEEELHLTLPPKRPKIRREYQDLLAPDRINEGWAMDFVSDWFVGPGQEKVHIINIMDDMLRQGSVDRSVFLYLRQNPD